MQALLAIAGLTLRAAFRFRLVLVLAVLLIGGVVVLPYFIKDDGTARGLTQILLTYTLTMITALLGFATLWLACGTLARDVEECQMQMVAVKPVPRWKIWLGKWLGILTLNAMLLTLSGGAVYGLLMYRAKQLPAEEQAVLRQEIMVARGSAKETVPDYQGNVEEALKARLQAMPVPPSDVDLLRRQIEEQFKARDQVVPPGMGRRWVIDLGLVKNRLQDKPLYLRTKFHTAKEEDASIYEAVWEVGPPETAKALSMRTNLTANTFHEFQVPANMFDDQGKITISFYNYNDTALLFPLEDGMEVLYREGSFGLNFARGVAIIFCWLALLAALGLSAASILSFPVAAFFSLGILVIGLSSGTLRQVLEEGSILGVNHETGVADAPAWIDYIALPVFKVMLDVINLVQGFSPVEMLSSGRSITWGQLGLAFFQICIVMGGIFAAVGITIFTRRELATAQGTH